MHAFSTTVLQCNVSGLLGRKESYKCMCKFAERAVSTRACPTPTTAVSPPVSSLLSEGLQNLCGSVDN